MHWRRARGATAGGTALLGVFLSACGPNGAPRVSQTSRTLRVGVRQLPAAPTEGLRALAQTLTVESLARLNDDGRPEPWLAQGWTVGGDGMSLSVNLLPGVTFHDGSAVTAAVVANALRTTLPSTMGPAFDDVESVSAATEGQVVIRLRRPSRFLLEALETPVTKPGSQLIGTGPFVVVDQRSPSELRANANYYRGRAGIDRVSVQTFPSVRAAWAEMLRGRLDMLYEVGLDALDSLEASNQIAIYAFTRRYQYVVMLNTDSDVLRSKELRRALNMAIDRDAIVRDALNGHGVASSGPVWPRNYTMPAGAPGLRFDPGAAAAILSAGGRRASKAGTLHFTCFVNPDVVNERVALVLKRQLESVGVDMAIKEASMDEIIASVRERRFEAALMEMVSGPTLLRPYRLWHSSGANHANTPAIDAALDRVRHAPSDAEYAAAVAAFQQAVADDPPAIFLAWMERARAVSKRFVIPPAESGRDILANLRLWTPATDRRQASRN